MFESMDVAEGKGTEEIVRIREDGVDRGGDGVVSSGSREGGTAIDGGGRRGQSEDYEGEDGVEVVADCPPSMVVNEQVASDVIVQESGEGSSSDPMTTAQNLRRTASDSYVDTTLPMFDLESVPDDTSQGYEHDDESGEGGSGSVHSGIGSVGDSFDGKKQVQLYREAGMEEKSRSAEYRRHSRRVSSRMRKHWEKKDGGIDPWHRKQLACFEVDKNANAVKRILSRAEIVQEARSMLPESAPTRKVLGHWLNSDAQTEEMKVWAKKMGFKSNFKAFKRYLKRYLRNSLQPRDIRQVDPQFAPKPALWVRHSAIIVSLEKTRAIILHNKMFLFDPDSETTQDTLKVVQHYLLGIPDGIDSNEALETFEFKALEGILYDLVTHLEAYHKFLNEKINQVMTGFSDKSLAAPLLEPLRLFKQKLSAYHTRVERAEHVLTELLDEDEDMANMYLTEKYRSPYKSRPALDHDEVEVLLEAYMQQVDDLLRKTEALKDNLDHEELMITLRLDTLRNKLLTVELVISIVAMTLSIGSFISGIFGMNLYNPLFKETTSSWVFYGVVLAIIFVVFIGSSCVVKFLHRKLPLFSFLQR